MSLSASLIAESASTAHADAASLLTSAPYARPVVQTSPSHAVDAMLIDAIRANIGPYIPESVRVIAPVATVAAFAATPSIAPSAEASLIESSRIEASRIEASSADASSAEVPNFSEPSVGESRELPSIDAFVDHDSWSLHEAGSVVSDLSKQLPSNVARDAQPSSTSPALDAWSDDDMMDIMPLSTADAAHASSQAAGPKAEAPANAADSRASHWASQAREREAHTPSIDRQRGAVQTEAAAQLLESLARRVRDGELLLPGFSAEMGDAAALASALAALLGVRH